MNQRNDPSNVQNPVWGTADYARRMSAADFARWGVDAVAYARKVENPEGGEAFAIFAADGQPIGMAGSLAAADAGLSQNDIELVNVH
jgi:hypothetical protein